MSPWFFVVKIAFFKSETDDVDEDAMVEKYYEISGDDEAIKEIKIRFQK